jgi:hypothetical protein
MKKLFSKSHPLSIALDGNVTVYPAEYVSFAVISNDEFRISMGVKWEHHIQKEILYVDASNSYIVDKKVAVSVADSEIIIDILLACIAFYVPLECIAPGNRRY